MHQIVTFHNFEEYIPGGLGRSQSYRLDHVYWDSKEGNLFYTNTRNSISTTELIFKSTNESKAWEFTRMYLDNIAMEEIIKELGITNENGHG